MLVTTREPVRHRAGDYTPKHRNDRPTDARSMATGCVLAFGRNCATSCPCRSRVDVFGPSHRATR